MADPRRKWSTTINKHETSKLNSHSDRDCLHWVFAKGGSGAPAAGWRLSGVHDGRGINALKNLTTGVANTETGWYSLFTNTSGSYNTGVGAGTLLFNNGEENTAAGVAALLKQYHGLVTRPLVRPRF